MLSSPFLAAEEIRAWDAVRILFTKNIEIVQHYATGLATIVTLPPTPYPSTIAYSLSGYNNI